MNLKFSLLLFLLIHYTNGKCLDADCNAIESILEENKKAVEPLLEGDILTEKTQINVQRDTIDRRFNVLWPNNILDYTMADSIPGGDKQRVRDALSSVSAVSCLQFREHTSNPPTAHVEVFRGDGCFSFIGRTGGRQQLSLAAGCMNSGIIIHEFFHALGFFHEQSRPDRNQFVRVNLQNVIQGTENNFRISNRINSLGSTYDPKSVMHYSRFAFSRNGQPTIELISNPQATLGGRQMTTEDINQLNLLYQCSTTTPSPNPVTTVEPTQGPSTPEPTSGTSTLEPTSGTSTPEPTSGTSTFEPTSGTSTPEPTSGTSTPEPTSESSTLEPTSGTSTPEPTSESSTLEPTSRPTTDPGCVDRKPRRCRQIVWRFGRGVCNRPKVQADCQQTCRLCNKGCVDRRPRRCRQIVRRFGRGVCNRPRVQADCQQTCRLCNTGCSDLGRCSRVRRFPILCQLERVAQRCAQTCSMCN